MFFRPMMSHWASATVRKRFSQIDATRILIYEAKVADVNDPVWAGSYFMESLTDAIEAHAMKEIEK
ncbi:MAG: methylmalonyl-CoA mutase family protein [Desulfobacterales bacterium]